MNVYIVKSCTCAFEPMIEGVFSTFDLAEAYCWLIRPNIRKTEEIGVYNSKLTNITCLLITEWEVDKQNLSDV